MPNVFSKEQIEASRQSVMEKMKQIQEQQKMEGDEPVAKHDPMQYEFIRRSR